jgi:3',5'-cyclic AMP phosphodiesterase CpdA
MKFVKSHQSENMANQSLERVSSPNREAFTLAHLSDPHLSLLKGVKFRELMNKRAYGYLSWHLRRHNEHEEAVLNALLQDMRSSKPDHIAITGDLTHLGLPKEFRSAREMLKSIGSPNHVTVIPGNHDAYVRASWKRTFCLWWDYMASDALQRPPEDMSGMARAFPILRVRGHIALIGVSTALPTLPLLAVGRIGQEQLGRLEKILMETREKNLFRVLLIHHPPVAGVVSWRKRLTDRSAFQTLVGRYGAELILHGHSHRNHLGHMVTSQGKVSVIGASSASAIGRNVRRRARFHLCHLMQNAGQWELFLSVRVYSPEKKQFVEENRSRLLLPG